VTETIPEIAALEAELPMVVDLEGFTYMRQDQKGMLIGIYETRPQHWSMDGAPWDYGVELLPENIDRIADELELVHRRYPVLQTAGVRKWVNGGLHLFAGRQPARRPGRGQARLLARLRASWRDFCRAAASAVAGGTDDPWRGVDGHLRPRHGQVRRLRVNREYIKQTTASSTRAASS